MARRTPGTGLDKSTTLSKSLVNKACERYTIIVEDCTGEREPKTEGFVGILEQDKNYGNNMVKRRIRRRAKPLAFPRFPNVKRKQVGVVIERIWSSDGNKSSTSKVSDFVNETHYALRAAGCFPSRNKSAETFL